MKRVISLVLAVVLLLSVTAVPVAAEGSAPSLSLSVVPVTIGSDGTITENSESEFKAGDYIMLKVTLNNDATAHYVQAVQFAVTYDSEALTTVQKSTSAGKIGPGVTKATTTPEAGVATLSLMTDGWLEVAANGSVELAGFLFQVNDAVETGTYHFGFDTISRVNKIEALLDTEAVKAEPIELDFANTTFDVAITGNPPTLQSISITPLDDEGKATTTYGEEKTFELKALSDKSKDITGLVEKWSVAKKDDETEANVSTITFGQDKKTVTVGDKTNAGIYTIKAIINGIPATQDITVYPAEISSMAFSLTAPVKNATPGQARPLTTGIEVTETEWYKAVEGQDDPVALEEGEKFAPSTVYEAKISYTTDKNHVVPLTTEEKPNIDTTIAGATVNMNNDHTVWCTFPETLAADPVTITVNGTITAKYGQKLNEIDLSDHCSATFNNENVTGRFAWENGNQFVGDVGTHEYTAVFTPNADTYAVTRQTVSVTVNPASIKGAEVTIDDQTYGEDAPVPTVTLGDKTLVLGTDYEVTYSEVTGVGTATVTITGKGNYTGEVTKNFQITKSINHEDIKVELSRESRRTS